MSTPEDLVGYSEHNPFEGTPESMVGYMVVLQPIDDQWRAYCPDVSGIAAWGETPEEAAAHYSKVLRRLLDQMRKDGVPAPPQDSLVWTVWLKIPSAP